MAKAKTPRTPAPSTPTPAFKIDVNIGRLLADVNAKLYGSAKVILDELVQNAARSASPTLHVTLARSHKDESLGWLEVVDAGVGLRNPADLLTLASSGWSKEVTESEDPFGMGFWSTTIAASKVEVWSNQWHVVIDADKLRATKSVEGVVEVKTLEVPQPGFRVRLYSPTSVLTVNSWANENEVADKSALILARSWRDLCGGLGDRLADMVRYSEFEAVTLRTVANGWSVTWQTVLKTFEEVETFAEKKLVDTLLPTRLPLHACPEVEGAVIVDTDLFVGALWPQGGWSKPEKAFCLGVQTRFQRRVVERFDGFHAGGLLHIKPGKASPRAPDRKAWIRDQQFTDVKASVTEHVRAMYRGLLLSRPEALDGFVEQVDEVLSDDDVLELVQVDMFDFAQHARQMTPTIEGTDMEVAEAPAREVPSTTPIEFQIASEAVTEVPEEKNVYGEVTRQRGQRVGLSHLPTVTFYVGSDEASRFGSSIDLVKKLGFALLLVRNKVMQRALRIAKERGQDVRHVGEIDDAKQTKASATEVPLSPRIKLVAEKALANCARLCEVDSLHYAHLSSTSELVFGDRRIPLHTESSGVLGMFWNGRIVIEVEHVVGIVKRALEQSDDAVLAATLELLPTVAHEVAHAESADHDVRFYETAEMVMHKALARLARSI